MAVKSRYSCLLPLFACQYEPVANRCAAVDVEGLDQVVTLPEIDGDQKVRADRASVALNDGEVLVVFTGGPQIDAADEVGSAPRSLYVSLLSKSGEQVATCAVEDGASLLEQAEVDLGAAASPALALHEASDFIGLVYGSAEPGQPMSKERLLFRSLQRNGCPSPFSEPLVLTEASAKASLYEPILVAPRAGVFLAAWGQLGDPLEPRVEPLQLVVIAERGGIPSLVWQEPKGIPIDGVVTEVAAIHASATDSIAIAVKAREQQSATYSLHLVVLDAVTFEVQERVVVHQWEQTSDVDARGLSLAVLGERVVVGWVAASGSSSVPNIWVRSVDLAPKVAISERQPLRLSSKSTPTSSVSLLAVNDVDVLAAWTSTTDTQHSERGRIDWALWSVNDGLGVVRDFQQQSCSRRAVTLPTQGAGNVQIGRVAIVKAGNDVQAIYDKVAKGFGTDRVGWSVWGLRMALSDLVPTD